MFKKPMPGLRATSFAMIAFSLSPSAWAGSTLDSLCTTEAMSSDYSGNSAQAQQYCAAGKAAEKAASADGDVWIIYAAAATVCTSACAASMAGMNQSAKALEFACSGSSIGASVADAVQTKNYMTALMSVVTTAGIPAYNMANGETLTQAVTGGPTIGSALSALTGGGSTAAMSGAVAHTGSGLTASTDPALAGGSKSGVSQGNLSACLSAASNAYSAYTKHSDENSSEATVQQSVQELQALESSSATTASGTGATSVGTSNAGNTLSSGIAGGTIGNSLGASTAAAATTPTADASCSGSSTMNGAQCAATASAVPIMSPPLASALQAVTGLTPSQYAAKAAQQGPGAAIASGLGSGATPFANQLDAMAGGLLPDGGSYASGGHGGAGGGNDMDKMMGSLLEQFGQKKKGDDKPTGVSDVNFAKRAIASVNPEEDRNLSLFTRVASRYASLTPRMTPGMTTGAIDTAPLPALPFATK